MDDLSRSGLEYAKRLIQAGQRKKAAVVLRTIEHPTADEWLTKLGAVRSTAWRRYVIVGAILLVIAAAVYQFVFIPTSAWIAEREILMEQCRQRAGTDCTAYADRIQFPERYAAQRQETNDALRVTNEYVRLMVTAAAQTEAAKPTVPPDPVGSQTAVIIEATYSYLQTVDASERVPPRP
jgi:hypothetical protein